MKRRIEKAPLPQPAALRELIGGRADELSRGAVVIDADAQGATGVDILMVGEGGRPVFVDVVSGDAESVPARVFEHLAWIEENGRLFMRAYARDGIQEMDRPEIVFVAGGFPRGVIRALSVLGGTRVRLVRAEHFIIDGESELMLEEIASTVEPGIVTGTGDDAGRSAGHIGPDADKGAPMTDASTAVAAASASPRREASLAAAGSGDVETDSVLGVPVRLEDKIESEPVLTLLKLFRSGVDGLDGRVVETQSDGGVAFELAGRPLARVSVSPGSFTVTPGDRVANPIVVSDRVSLERALNSVVSLFVREEGPEHRVAGDNVADGLDENERAELVGIWGSGLSGGEN